MKTNKEVICDVCKGKVVRKKVPYSLYGMHISDFSAKVCEMCGEVVFDEKVSDQIEEATKKKGIYSYHQL